MSDVKSSSKRDAAPGSKPDDVRVLIVSDELSENDMLRTLLSLEGGYEVKLAQNFRTGHMLAMRGEYDLLLIDQNLGDGLGTDLVQRLRKETHYKRVPMIISSGFSVELEAKAAGADAFLEKPYDPTQLLGLMSRLSKEKDTETDKAQDKDEKTK